MNRAMWRCVVGLFLCLATDRAATAGVQEEILEVVKAYDAALLKRDQAFLENLYMAEGQFVLPDGRHLDKKGYIAAQLRRTLTEAKSSRQVIQSISDAFAVEAGTYLAIGTEDDKPIHDHLSYTTVWVKHDGKWRIAAEQGTRIEDDASLGATGRPSDSINPAIESMMPLKKWVGDWTLETEQKDGPNGAVEKMTGKLTVRMILDGAFLEERYELQNLAGRTVDKGMFLTTYDTSARSFVEHGFFQGGVTTKAEGTVDGNVRTMAHTVKDPEGRVEKGRSQRTLADDGMSTISWWESYDEKTGKWLRWFEGKATKVRN